MSDAPSALYRRYRPQRFADLIGQDGPAQVLTSTLEKNSLGHAYLFSGPRGCGKTSTARVLAKAINCASPEGVEPCNVCPSCVSITNGSSMDVQEIDAASNNGVDAIRELMSKVSLASSARRKVYIIDEVHMLSAAAANAFLKTLEEAPSHVVFILATTDPQKVLATVRSRCQPLAFKLVAPSVLVEHFRKVALDANLTGPDGLAVSEDILTAAAFQANGSVRDGLSALDSLALSGIVDAPRSLNLLRAIATGELVAVFSAIASANQDGTSVRSLAEETAGLLRELFLVQMDASSLLSTPDWGDRTELAQSMGARRTVQALNALGDAILAMKSEYDQRVNLEVNLARYCKSANQ